MASSRGSCWRLRRSEVGRANARTCQPAPHSARATAAPTKPVAPVTSALTGVPGKSRILLVGESSLRTAGAIFWGGSWRRTAGELPRERARERAAPGNGRERVARGAVAAGEPDEPGQLPGSRGESG